MKLVLFDPAAIGLAAAKGYAAGIVHGAAPWHAALAAYKAHTGADHSALHLAAAGHRNALAIVRRELAEVTGCSCGADEPCTPDCDPPTRRRLREALQALLAALAIPKMEPPPDLPDEECCTATRPTGLVGEFRCSLRRGHAAGRHEAWAGRDGARPELLDSWSDGDP